MKGVAVVRWLARGVAAAGLVVASCGQTTESPSTPGVGAPEATVESSTTTGSVPAESSATTNTDATATDPPAVTTQPTTDPSVEVHPPADPVPQAPPVLRRGDEGPWVVAMQEELRRHGYEIDADGFFGPASEAAVLGFQTGHGLEVDGLCGPNTWAELIHGEVLPVVEATRPMTLRADGLGPFDFGDDPVPIVARLTAELGIPTSDATHQGGFSCGDDWCRGRIRTVEWQGVGGARFTVRFNATTSEFAFAGWYLDGYGGLSGFDFATPGGITLGSTAAELLAADSNVRFGYWPEHSCGDAWWDPSSFRVGDPGDGYSFDGLRGWVRIEDPWAPLDPALVDLGFPEGTMCMYDAMCSELFATVQQMLGLPVTYGLDRATWTALGLPLPPDANAPVTVLTAGNVTDGC